MKNLNEALKHESASAQRMYNHMLKEKSHG